MSRFWMVAVAVAVLGLGVQPTFAQRVPAGAGGLGQQRTLGGGVQGSAGRQGAGGMGQAGGASGLGQQTGQLANEGIQRQPGGFVGADLGGGFPGQGATQGMGMGQGGMMGPAGMMGLGGAMGRGGMGGLGMGRGMGMGGMGMGGMGGGFGAQRLNMGGQMGAGAGGARQQLRVPIRLEVPLQAPSTELHRTPVSGRLEQRLTRLPAMQGAGRVVVMMEGQTAVLEGVVASDYQRDLVGRLALLEPGIGAVRNELQVEGAGAAAAPLPAPAR